MDIQVNRTLYMSCQAGTGLEPLTVRSKGERSLHIELICRDQLLLLNLVKVNLNTIPIRKL